VTGAETLNTMPPTKVGVAVGVKVAVWVVVAVKVGVAVQVLGQVGAGVVARGGDQVFDVLVASHDNPS